MEAGVSSAVCVTAALLAALRAAYEPTAGLSPLRRLLAVIGFAPPSRLLVRANLAASTVVSPPTQTWSCQQRCRLHLTFGHDRDVDVFEHWLCLHGHTKCS